MRPRSRNEFEIAVICALPLEFDAVEASFDEHYDEFDAAYGKHLGDSNWYRAGRVGSHHVVLTCLPGMGKGSAASVASSLQVSFPMISLAFLVGICGGVPYPSEQTEIILGDVIVSDKVVEYDFGRQYPDGFQRKRVVKEIVGVSGSSRTARSFLSGLKTHRMHDQLQDDLLKYQQDLQNNLDGRWNYPGIAQDQLFEASYRHKHYHQHPSTTCLCADCQCNNDPICEMALENDCRKLGCMGLRVPRIRLSSDCPRPHVHFGPMASADTVMKSGEHRDQLAKAEKVIGFEMEGAGIWDNLPCVIIKGVCDYADSHKNKMWQNYAAATAASCTKAFLQYWARKSSDRREFLPTAYGADKDMVYEEMLSDIQRKELLNLLRFDQIDARQMSLRAAQGKTCRWMLQNSKYKDWLDAEKLRNHNGFFWIKGKPGAGKSIMMKFLFVEARKAMKGSVVISFFFNARGGGLEKSIMGLYRSLLLHLLEKMPDLMSCLDHCGTHGLEAIKNTGWQTEMLKEIFTLVVDRLQSRRVFCYVDALDECPEDDVRDMISLFEEIGAREKSSEFRVCFSSRHYPEITIKTGLQLVLERERDHSDDIGLYIESQLKIENTPQAEDIKSEILRKSSGIFLWVALVVPILNKEHDRGRIKALKRKLGEIPTGLHDLFLDILTRDCKNVDEMAHCIQSILFAKRPLSPQELQVAVLTGLEDQPQDPFDASEVTSDVLRKFVLDVSKGLAEITKSKAPTVQFIHESVRDFLLKDGGIGKLPIKEKNIEGRSHATFTRICLLQLGADLDFYKVDSPRYGKPDLLSSVSNAKEVSSKFPFLEYAVNHVVHHANAAQNLGVPQESFFERLNLDRWICLYNAFRKHSSQAYSGIHLLYILSEQGAGALIRIHPDRSRHLSLRGGRFKLPLIAALYSGNNDAARALVGIDHSGSSQPDKAQPGCPDNPGTMKLDAFRASRSLISYLSEFGDTVLLRKVLETGEYKLNKWDQGTYSRVRDNPLYYASSEAVVELLIEFAADIGLFPGISQNDAVADTSMAMGHESCNLSRFQQMLKRFPRILKHGDENGQTFLAYAAERGFEQLANVAILHASETLDETDSQGRTPFSFAAQGRTNPTGRLAVMKDLYAAHANPNTPDCYEKTPLHYAVMMPFNDEIIRFLSSRGEVNLEQKDQKQFTALASVVQEGRKGYVEPLLTAGADPMSPLPDGSTMLIYCVRMGYLKIFRVLLSDKRCEPDAPDSNGRTALSWCASVCDEVAATMMSMLLKLETVNPNSRDNGGRTALERTIHGAQPTMVSLLCSRVQFLDLRDGGGRNLLRLVVSLCQKQNCLQFREITRLLLASGHVKPHSRKGLQGSLLESCKSSGLEEISQMIETFLGGGDLGQPLMKYPIP